MKLSKKYLALGLLGSVLTAGSAYAATQSVTANIRFDTALALTKNFDINFGMVKASTAGDFTIDTAGTITPANGGVVIGGTPVVGDITIVGSTDQTIAISTGTYVAAGIGDGVTLSDATCKYGTATAAACDTPLTAQAAPGAGTHLLLGVKATVDANQTAGTHPTPAFTVTVVYG